VYIYTYWHFLNSFSYNYITHADRIAAPLNLRLKKNNNNKTSDKFIIVEWYAHGAAAVCSRGAAEGENVSVH